MTVSRSAELFVRLGQYGLGAGVRNGLRPLFGVEGLRFILFRSAEWILEERMHWSHMLQNLISYVI